MKYEPRLDGISHVNAYTQGATQMGKILSNMFNYPFECSEGNFKSCGGRPHSSF